MGTIVQTNFNFPGQTGFYKGKVRDVYNIQNRFLVMVASDRISAFDYILPKGIPFKGQVLNLIASKFLDLTKDIVPNWKIDSPHPNITIGKCCEPYRVEMVVRGYLTGHAWREYKAGKRKLCGVDLPEGMKEHDQFPRPIITPATKADEGHDEDISREDIIRKKIVPEAEYLKLEKYTLELFKRGTEVAKEKGLILVDTKYEFGNYNGEILLIDEVHTPDSSRYFYLNGYEERQKAGLSQKQLSKEYVREWLIENGFQGKEGQKMPDMPDDFVNSVTDRYVELYEQLTGDIFHKITNNDELARIENAVLAFLDRNI